MEDHTEDNSSHNNKSDLEDKGISAEAQEAAIRLAEQLAGQMHPNDLGLSYSLLDTILPQLKLGDPGNKLSALIPPELDVGEALSLRPTWKRGKDFAKVIVCNSRRDVRAAIEGGADVMNRIFPPETGAGA